MMSFVQLCLGLLCAAGILFVVWQIAIQASRYMIRHSEAPPGLKMLTNEPAGVRKSFPLPDGGQISAWHRGSGQPVVIIPDAGFSVSAYTPVWSLLCGYGFQVVVFQPRSIHDYPSARTHIEDLEAVLQHLNIQQPILLGHGFGAYIATLHQQQAHTNQHTRAAGILAVAPYAGGKRLATISPRKLSQLFHKASRYQKGLSAFGEGASAASILALKQHTDYFPWEYLNRDWEPVSEGPILPASLPLTILASYEDGIIPFLHGKQLAEASETAKLGWIKDGAGHMIIWERPTAVAEEVRQLDKAARQQIIDAQPQNLGYGS